jgi:hypothetical protein
LNFQEVSANKTTKKFAPSILMRKALVLSNVYCCDCGFSGSAEKGFLEEVFYLENFASFRGSLKVQ